MPPATAAASRSITTFAIHEFNNGGLFDCACRYLETNCLPSASNINIEKPKHSKAPTFTIKPDQVMEDTFEGVPVKWFLRTTEKKYKIFGSVYRRRKIRYFELSFPKKHSTKMFSRYLPRVTEGVAAASQSTTACAIYEFDPFNNRKLYDSVCRYLETNCFPSAPNVNIQKPKRSTAPTFTILPNQVMEDIFDGVRVKWSLRTTEKKYKIFGSVYRRRKIRYLELSFPKRHAITVYRRYLPRVTEGAAAGAN